MVKITGPLFSNRASGSLAGDLTFSQRRSGQQVRFQRKQKINAPSDLQTDQQCLYRLAWYRWSVFSVAEKKVYNDLAAAKNLKMTGWNYFCQLVFLDPFTYLGLCGYWNMNYISSGKILDISGKNNHCMLSPSYPSNCPQLVAGKNKTLHNALSFDGIDDVVYSSAINFSISTAVTVCLWFNQKSKADENGFFAVPNRCQLACTTYNQIRFRLRVVSGGFNNLAYDNPVAFGNWQHFAFTYDSVLGQSSMYIDGVSVSFTGVPPSGNISDFLGSILRIGREWNDGNYYHKGELDEFRIYNRVLSASEILKMYKTENKVS